MMRRLKQLFSLVLLAALLGTAGWLYIHRTAQPAATTAPTYKTAAENDVYVRFDMEAYDSIAKNYWNKLDDGKLSELFRLSLSKASGTEEKLPSADRAGVAAMLGARFAAATSTDARHDLALTVLQVALYNLEPAGRDGLLSNKQETALRQEVSNVHPEADLYQDLGVAKDAPAKDIEAAYTKQTALLKNATSSEDKARRDRIAYARSVLTNANTKTLYDQAKIEPTVFTHVMGKTLYVYISQVSPTTLREFGLAIDAASSTPSLASMVIDLRGNIGGALDFLQNFLGLFIGQNQYAFDLYHQGDYQVQRTAIGKYDELGRFTEYALLTDNMTQSTAELTTAAFKRYHLAHVVGGTTRGWGTVENTYPLTTVIEPNVTYALLLVNSITLRDDGQPIESRGVDPDIDIAKKGWQAKVSELFTSSSLASAVKTAASKPPMK